MRIANSTGVRRLTCVIGVAVALWVVPAFVTAVEPLHERIDARIAAQFQGRRPAPLADDAEFLRRVWLDLAGVIPTTSEAREFLADPSPDKRSRLVDRLLAAPTYPRRMRELFHVVLMERRGDNAAWDNYLQSAFEANKPWDQLVREILFPDDKDPQRAGAGFFYTKRLEAYGQNPIDHPGLTRDVGRLFLGIDLQCAQCHDHLFIGDYKQREFQGLYSVYLNVTAKGDQPVPAVIEKPLIKKLEFVSVFDSTKQETGPRIPFGVELPIPEAPAAGTQPASALALIARDLPRVDNDRFSRNIANRLWFLMMGRGLVHPLDLHHSDNPPSHPELLDLLAREFATHQFDIRWMLRELALSQTYQRSSQGDAVAEPPPPESYLWGIEKRLSAEQLLRSTLRATGDLDRLEPPPGTAAAGEWKELRSRFLTAYANEPREAEGDYLATVKGALFALNDGKLLDLMKRRSGNLLDRVATLSSLTEVADELYLTVFTRFPTAEERGEIEALFEKDPARREQSLATFAWAMLASIEFGINH